MTSPNMPVQASGYPSMNYQQASTAGTGMPHEPAGPFGNWAGMNHFANNHPIMTALGMGALPLLGMGAYQMMDGGGTDWFGNKTGGVSGPGWALGALGGLGLGGASAMMNHNYHQKYAQYLKDQQQYQAQHTAQPPLAQVPQSQSPQTLPPMTQQ